MKATPAYRPYIQDVFPVDGSYCPPSQIFPVNAARLPRLSSAVSDLTDAMVHSGPCWERHAAAASARDIEPDWQAIAYSDPSAVNPSVVGIDCSATTTTSNNINVDIVCEGPLSVGRPSSRRSMYNYKVGRYKTSKKQPGECYNQLEI